MKNKNVNIAATAKNILDKANISFGTSIDIEKLNLRIKNKDEKFFKEAAEFVGVPVVYY
jgi:hypothetical protein